VGKAELPHLFPAPSFIPQFHPVLRAGVPLAAALDLLAQPGDAPADCRGLYRLLWNEMEKQFVELHVGEQTQTDAGW